MRKVIRYQTRDGELHVSYEAAQRHAENIYGLALSAIVHKMLRVDKYALALDFVDTELPAFGHLIALKADIDCENPADFEADNEE